MTWASRILEFGFQCITFPRRIIISPSESAMIELIFKCNLEYNTWIFKMISKNQLPSLFTNELSWGMDKCFWYDWIWRKWFLETWCHFTWCHFMKDVFFIPQHLAQELKGSFPSHKIQTPSRTIQWLGRLYHIWVISLEQSQIKLTMAWKIL